MSSPLHIEDIPAASKPAIIAEMPEIIAVLTKHEANRDRDGRCIHCCAQFTNGRPDTHYKKCLWRRAKAIAARFEELRGAD